MLKREPKTGNLEQGTILSEGTITFTIYVSVSFQIFESEKCNCDNKWESSLCHKLWISNAYGYATQRHRP